MTEVVYSQPTRRNGRGFHTVVARHGSDEMLETTHVTARPITLWYGSTSPMTLPTGTPVRVLSHDDDVARIVYDGIDASHATVGADAIAGLTPEPPVDSTPDASETTWQRSSTPAQDSGRHSRRSSGARSPNGTPKRSSSSPAPLTSTSGTGSSSSSSRRRPKSSSASSNGSAPKTTPSSSGGDARPPLEQLLAGEPIDQRYLGALKHLADAGAFPADTRLELDTAAGTVRLADDPSGERRSVPDIG